MNVYANWTRMVLGVATLVWSALAVGLVVVQLVALALALAQGKPLVLFMALTEWAYLFAIPAGLGLLNKAGSVASDIVQKAKTAE